MDKSSLRKTSLALRKAIPPDRVHAATKAAVEFVMTFPKEAVILSFFPFPSEINILPANKLLISRSTLLLPGGATDELAPLWVASTEELYHPWRVFPVEHITHVLVPALAFDIYHYRLGYGKGCYDRWLARYPLPHTIGIGYREQLLPQLPHEPHDVPLKELQLF